MGRVRDALDLLLKAQTTFGPRAVVAVSGGKDSLAVLRLAIDALGLANVGAYFMYIVPGLSIGEGEARKACERMGMDIDNDFRIYPHPDTVAWLSRGIHAPRRGQVRRVSFTQIENAACADLLGDFVVAGHRSADSARRRVMLKRWGYLDELHRRAYPIGGWLDREVYGYLRLSKIPLPTRFGDRRVSGIDMTPECMHTIREHYPDDFAKITQVYPHAKALALRQELVIRDAPRD